MSDSRFAVGLSMVVVSLIMVFAFGLFLLPSDVGGVQVVVRTETSVSTQTAFLTTISTSTERYTATQSVTGFVTVTQAMPLVINVTGTVTTGGVGTTPTSISFVGHNHAAITVQVTDGKFFVQLPNQEIYATKVTYSGTPVGGSCSAPGIVLDTTTNVSLALSC